VILIASASTERLISWQQALQGPAAVVSVHRAEALLEALTDAKPRILLLDIALPGFDALRGINALRRASPSTRIVAMTGAVSDDFELSLFKSGVRGCCRTDINLDILRRVALAVDRGELWIRRSITPRLLDELGANVRNEFDRNTRAGVGRLTELTQREREIAMLISDGGSNKQIARRLAIAERTVKAHLTAIFRKIGVSDRLGLALEVRAFSTSIERSTSS
jgi:two-component system NarL family response regulator